MDTKTYDVKREHIGADGRLYSPHGDFCTREAVPHEVAHLVENGVLVEKAEAVDAAKPEPESKAGKAKVAPPENKAEDFKNDGMTGRNE